MVSDFHEHMFNTLFPFVESILEPTEEDASHFIAQQEAFFASAEKNGKVPVTPRPLSEETYKQMWMLRYQQQMGQISFLELLDKYEEILGISSHTGSE